MAHFIEGREVKESDIGSPVTYIPRHAGGNASHPDAEGGFISSFTESSLFVKFTSPNGAKCDPDDLVWGGNSRSKSFGRLAEADGPHYESEDGDTPIP